MRTPDTYIRRAKARDTIEHFLAGHTVYDVTQRTPLADLWRAYTRDCRVRHIRGVVSPRLFGNILRDLGYPAVRVGHVPMRRNVALKRDAADDPTAHDRALLVAFCTYFSKHRGQRFAPDLAEIDTFLHRYHA